MNALSIFNPAIANDLFEALDRSISSFAAPSMGSNAGNIPRVDIKETKDNYVMEIDLPGLTEKDISLNLKDRVLTVSSATEKKVEKTEKPENDFEYLVRERRTFEFVRRFSVPADVNESAVSAHFKNGVLTITMAKQPEVQPKNIQISIE